MFIYLDSVECEGHQIKQEFADFLEVPPNRLPRICKNLKNTMLMTAPPKSISLMAVVCLWFDSQWGIRYTLNYEHLDFSDLLLFCNRTSPSPKRNNYVCFHGSFSGLLCYFARVQGQFLGESYWVMLLHLSITCWNLMK